MKLSEARAKLEELSEGKYRSLSIEITEGDLLEAPLVTYCVYIDGHRHHTGKTWEEALTRMEYAIQPRPTKPEIEDIDEADIK